MEDYQVLGSRFWNNEERGTRNEERNDARLGLVAIHVWSWGGKIEWDWKNERIIGDAEANRLLTKQYRAPWKV